MTKIIRKISTHGAIENRTVHDGEQRGYLGMSACGEKCLRKRWLQFHWASEIIFTPRTMRIFEVGHMFERIAIADLKSIGMQVFKRINGKVIDMTGDRNEEQEEITGVTGHEGGHPDGRALGVLEAPKTEHTLEVKTMAEGYWKECKKVGVKKADPKYWAQVQRYMKGMKTKRTFFMAINKNTCEYYFERIEFDEGFANELVRKEISVIASTEIPTRGYVTGHYRCEPEWCNQTDVCEKRTEPQEHCRTCEFSDLELDGVWVCDNKKSKHKGKINKERQLKGCKKYKRGWGL